MKNQTNSAVQHTAHICKKTIVLLTFFVFNTTSNAIPPRWLTEIYRCTWRWDGDATLKSTNSNGTMCSYERPMKGSSWLWGDCGTETYTYTIPCEHDPNFFPIPDELSEQFYTTIAQNMINLENLGFNIQAV